MAQYLKIENSGVASSDSFTLFGLTSKRGEEKSPHTIGQFGSGNKHAINLLLRMGINPVIFCGNLRLSFYTEPHYFDGQDGKRYEAQRVCYRVSGKDKDGKSCNRTEKLSMVLGYGSLDWDEVSLALREFVSNSLDCGFERGLNVEQAASSVKIDVVDETQVRASSGTTRVFIEYLPTVEKWHKEMNKWFLHFAEPSLVTETILPKSGYRGDAPAIYRRGVFVRTFESADKPSLFDYNLSDIKINESRTCSDWDVRHAAAKAVADAPRGHLATLFSALQSGKDFWEKSFDNYGLVSAYELDSVVAKRKEEWSAAFLAISGEEAAIVTETNGAAIERVSKKGYGVVRVPEVYAEAAKKYGVKTDADVLNEDERHGRVISEPTPDVLAALDKTWALLERVGFTNGKEKPQAKCFYKHLESGSQNWGFQKDDTVYVHTDISKSCEFLDWCLLEEIGHFLTNANDCTRDFQSFFIRLSAKLASLVN